MVARQPATKLVPVGSVTWISNERSNICQLQEQDIEDFTYSATNEMEWLNEHMAEIFERNVFDMAELLKTPGRLRGKTPMTGRKFIRAAEQPLGNIFAQPPLPSADSGVFKKITDIPNNREFARAQERIATPQKSPVKSARKPTPKKLLNQSQDSAFQESLNESESTVPYEPVGDSGVWSNSPPSQSSRPIAKPTKRRSPAHKLDPPQEPTGVSSTAPKRDYDRRVSVESFDTAQEEPSDALRSPSPAVQSSPIKRSQMPGSARPAPEEVVSSKRSVDPPASGPRRSGRLADRSSTGSIQADAQAEAEEETQVNTQISYPDIQQAQKEETVPPSSPPVISKLSKINTDLPDASNDSKTPITPITRKPRVARTPARSPTKSPQKTPAAAAPPPVDEEPAPLEEESSNFTSESPTGSPTSAGHVLRKNSLLNFATLPAREPLTTKKKSLGPRVTRESYAEQVRLNGAGRASWMGKKGNGKSLGASSKQIGYTQNQEEETSRKSKVELVTGTKRKSEVEETGRSRKKSRGSNGKYYEKEAFEHTATGGETDDSGGETQRSLELHNKLSTQRLHDKIQLLGKLNPSRPARSFPSAAPQSSNSAYPNLSQPDPEHSGEGLSRTKSDVQRQPPSAVTGRAEDEDWVPKPTPRPAGLVRNQTEDIQKMARERAATNQFSPSRNISPRKSPITVTNKTGNMFTHTKSYSTTSLNSPSRLPGPSSPLKSSFSYPNIAETTHQLQTAMSTPKVTSDGTLSAVKAHTSNVFKKAKEMLLKSSVSSATAKIESLTPPPKILQGSLQEAFNRNSPGLLNRQESQKSQKSELYPDLGSAVTKKDDKASDPTTNPTIDQLREGRQTRNSRTKESPAAMEIASPEVPMESVQEDQQSRDSKARENARGESVEPVPRPSSPKKTKGSTSGEPVLAGSVETMPTSPKKTRSVEKADKEAEIRKSIEARDQERKKQEEQLKKEKEELKRRQQEQELSRQEDEKKAKEAASRFREESAPISDNEEEVADRENRGRITSSTEPERPPSRLQKARFGKVKASIRQIKEQPKTKPAPVSIPIGTASQREMQNQRNNKMNTAPSSSTLISALKSSFEPSQSSQNGNQSQSAIPSSASAGSLRSASTATAQSKHLKSLAAAANQLKKEQEAKERKEALKREIDRRRQENARRQEEEQRKQAAAKQKGPPASSTKTLNRMQGQSNLRQKSEEPTDKRPDYQAASIYAKAKPSVKRVFQQEEGPEDQQYRHVPSKPGAPAYHQEGNKKRRTGEYDERPQPSGPSFNSVVKKVPPSKVPALVPRLISFQKTKELAPKGTIPHGYASASASASAIPSSLLKQPSKMGMPMPQVEGVKYSTQKIRFANETAPGPSGPSGATVTPGPPSAFKTPGAKSTRTVKTPAYAKESPLYKDGDSIELPEILTDSEDDFDPPNDFNVPNWAESPELRSLLRQQQAVNPEEIFGPMARLDMEAIFQRNDRPAARFRARTSSANWSGADRLTPAEIEADQEARKKMIEEGGWTYSGL